MRDPADMAAIMQAMGGTPPSSRPHHLARHELPIGISAALGWASDSESGSNGGVAETDEEMAARLAREDAVSETFLSALRPGGSGRTGAAGGGARGPGMRLGSGPGAGLASFIPGISGRGTIRDPWAPGEGGSRPRGGGSSGSGIPSNLMSQV